MEHNEGQGKKVVHLQIGDDHSYYGSIAQLFEDYTAEQLGISYFKTKNNLKAKGVIKESFITKAKGDVIDGDMRSSNRVESCVVEGNDMDELQERVSQFYSHVKVIDIHGNNMAILPS